MSRRPTFDNVPPSEVRQRGQALVLLVITLVAVLASVGLIIDGGNAWAHQRITQNGSDAAAEGGALILAARLAGSTTPAAGWDSAVNAAIAGNASANGIAVQSAYYTDICGIPLKADGTAALTADGSQDLSQADRVGSGALPATLSTTPTCPSRVSGPPAGVLVLGQQDLATYLASIVGIRRMTVVTQSTAVTGYLQGFCDSSQGEACAVLPIAVPVNTVTCDGQNKPITTGSSWNLQQVYTVPLCGNGPGNVGWLDWTPPGGGTSELIGSILHPNNPAIDLPSWQYVAQTGNPNSAGIETALRTYDGQVVMIPQFDVTCSSSPNSSSCQHWARVRVPEWVPGRERPEPVVSGPELRVLPDVQRDRLRLRQPRRTSRGLRQRQQPVGLRQRQWGNVMSRGPFRQDPRNRNRRSGGGRWRRKQQDDRNPADQIGDGPSGCRACGQVTRRARGLRG